jgi:ATP-binding cassette, subfamily B, multidrug efflux pump
MIRLFRCLKPYTLHIVFIISLLFIQVISDLYLPTLMSDIVNKGIVGKDIPFIWRTGGIMIAAAGVGIVAAIIAAFLSSRTSVGLGRILREKIFTKVESFSLHEFDKLGTSTLITRTTNDVTQIQQVTVMILSMMISAPLMCIGGIVMALREDKSLTWVLVVVVPILAAIIGTVLVKGIPLFKLMQIKLDKLNLVLRENLTGIRVIRAFNRIDR